MSKNKGPFSFYQFSENRVGSDTGVIQIDNNTLINTTTTTTHNNKKIIMLTDKTFPPMHFFLEKAV